VGEAASLTTRRGILRADLLKCAKASGADAETGLFPIANNGGPLNVGQPLPLGVSLGMTHVMSGLGGFPADFTFGHGSFLPSIL
jgi:hypothetical protein